jgi:tetratricopeptide (TPR) repeat protein
MSRSVLHYIFIFVLTVVLAGADTPEPLTAEYYYNCGKSKYHFKDYLGAIEDYNKAAELAPEVAKIFGSRAAAKRKLGDKKGAIADAQKAARLGDKEAQRILRFFGYDW